MMAASWSLVRFAGLFAAVSAAADASPAALSSLLPAVRGWAGQALRGDRRLAAAPGVCRAVALRLMPTPAVQAYDACFSEKINVNSSHDWSVPGAEVAAQIQCWCRNNLTATIREYSCCEHGDIYPMCSVDCAPDCSAPLARECIQECPSMCFEAAEYIVDARLCSGCDWARCWPVVGCLTRHAERRVENGTLARACHEPEFAGSRELKSYMDCWKVTPKHTSHWNILSSLVHCICREGVDRKARETHCCESVVQGGGVCDLECLSEQTCATQEAQTCVHDCQLRCPAYEVVPSADCMNRCLKEGSPCRRYVSCRPPSITSHVCDDGRWPESSSGCCKDNETKMVGCPALCETQRVWRLDRTRAIPWWARWHSGEGIITQCTCVGCPKNASIRHATLRRTVSESVWDNGQVMLVDIARREGLRLGPNRKMQELMLKRNSEIIQTIENHGDSGVADRRISAINNRYALMIMDAARLGDDPPQQRKRGAGRDNDDDDHDLFGGRMMWIVAAVVACSVTILCSIVIATGLVIRSRSSKTPISAFQQNQQVVIGSPVQANSELSGVTAGAPVTVSAPTKSQRGSAVAKDIS
uniref:Uncharacterized protein n=1 Tax=Alexandrium monilatum TaxID=311494 RepID=A0A7S4QAU9_9DINO